MKNLLIIYGPTGSGKTKISYEIIHQLKKKDLSDRNLKEIIQNIYDHHQWDFQYHDKNWPSSSHIAIINMDSKQIYYDLPSLTASPTNQEKSFCFHFLFNDELATSHLSVNNWFLKVMDFIDNTGFDYYILVGGSSFYLKYLLTKNFYYNNYNFDSLVDIFFCYFPWEFSIKYFHNNNYQPHINDNFRKYNFIKSYFSQKYSSHLLNYYGKYNNNSYIINKPIDYDYSIIIIDPDNEVLKNNIINRAQDLDIISLKKEAESLKNYSLDKNFSSIIGYNLLDHWDLDKFIELTYQYGKNQKKWINYFLKHKFFNYNYFYCRVYI